MFKIEVGKVKNKTGDMVRNKMRVVQLELSNIPVY